MSKHQTKAGEFRENSQTTSRPIRFALFLRGDSKKAEKRGMKWLTALALSLAGIAVLVFFGACASGTVSQKRKPATGRTALPLAGHYDLTLHTADIGSLTGRIVAEPTGNGHFRANSRPGAVSELIGGFKGFVAPIIARKQFGGGAFLHWDASGGEASSHGEIRLPLGTFVVDLPSWQGPAELRTPQGELAGFITLRSANPATNSGTDRRKLVNQIEQAFRERLYDPSLTNAPGVRAYLARLRQLSTVTRDDMEFLFSAFLARKLLPFSHVSLTRTLDPAFASRLKSDAGDSQRADIQLNWNGSVATIRALGFWQAEEAIDRAFEQVRAQKATGLIVDLRSCRGGDYSSMRIAAHLLSTPADAGVLFGATARGEVLAGKLDRFPEVSRIGSVQELTDLVRKHGAFRSRVQPVAQPYTGKVAVLIDRGTSSAAEPLAALLQTTGRARLFGARTAGAILSSERVDVGEGWMLQLPVFDYITPDGTRLEGKGVIPDIVCDPKEAPQRALETL